jgi:hypothetical protein
VKKLIRNAVLLSLVMINPVFAENQAPAQAKSNNAGNFTECAAIRMQEIALKHLETGKSDYFTKVPAGWTVVSGAGGEGHPKMLICR